MKVAAASCHQWSTCPLGQQPGLMCLVGGQKDSPLGPQPLGQWVDTAGPYSPPAPHRYRHKPKIASEQTFLQANI